MSKLLSYADKGAVRIDKKKERYRERQLYRDVSRLVVRSKGMKVDPEIKQIDRKKT